MISPTSGREIAPMRTSIKLLLIAFHFSACSYSTSFGRQLKLTLELEKSRFLEAEPIYAFVYLTNTGASDVNVYLFHDTQLHFSLYDEGGKPVTQTLSSIADAYFVKPRLLPAGEKMIETENLQLIFGNNRHNWTVYKNYLVAGRYSATVWYQHFNEQTRKGDTLISNTVDFEVARPRGDEGKAFQLLMEGLDLLSQRNYDLQIRKLSELIRLYPQSVYAPAAYDQQRLTIGVILHDEEKASGSRLRVIEEYPDRGAALYQFLSIMKINDKYYSREKKEELLKKYGTGHPNTRLGKASKDLMRTTQYIVK